MSIRWVATSDKSVLNISFRSTSKGFVNTAPAIPADTDFTAERIICQFRSLGSPRGNLSSIKSWEVTILVERGVIRGVKKGVCVSVRARQGTAHNAFIWEEGNNSGGNKVSFRTLTTTAVTYFGTVLSIPALTP